MGLEAFNEGGDDAHHHLCLRGTRPHLCLRGARPWSPFSLRRAHPGSGPPTAEAERVLRAQAGPR